MKDFTIGVLGGMGTYATIHMFEEYAEVFPAKKEWERPRIVIDNRCTMPSRVRAFIYNENVNQLIDEMSDSIQHLIDSGCDRIILACNTSHLFLSKIYERVPELEGKIIHIIENCVRVIKNDNIKSVYLLGSEGTISSKIYQDALEKEGEECITPIQREYGLLRECIEAVKQNSYNNEIENVFLNLISKYDAYILGCTELPILYKKYQEKIKCNNIYDPLLLSIQKLKREYDNE